MTTASNASGERTHALAEKMYSLFVWAAFLACMSTAAALTTQRFEAATTSAVVLAVTLSVAALLSRTGTTTRSASR